MASCDYRLCDVCGGKAFYDANLSYEHSSATERQPALVTGRVDSDYCLGSLGDWAVLCDKCSKTHMTQIVRRASAGDTGPE